MATSLHDLLQPQVILDVVSRIRKGRGRLGQWFGFHPTAYDAAEGVLRGPNTKTTPTRTGTYRIYDNTRTAAQARAPGTGPALIAPQPIGEVPYSVIRWHEKVRLLAEDLAQLSPIVGPNSAIDTNGQNYISRQIEYLATRMNNAVELATVGMTRGALYLAASGDSWIPQLVAPSAGTPYVTVNYQIPAGNKTKLDMLGAGDILAVSWDNPAAPILTDVLQIDNAFQALTGDSLTDIWISSVGWGNVLANTQVKAAAGTANTPFATYDRAKEKGFDGEILGEHTATLRGLPTVTWHNNNDRILADGGTDPSYASGTGTLTQVIPDTNALFSATPDGSWVDFITYGEPVSEQPGMPMVKREGWHYWSEWITQPSVVELIGLFNGIPRLIRPKNLAFGTVVY